MKFSISILTTVLASLASAAPVAIKARQSLGSSIVTNDCSFTTYLQLVSDTADPEIALAPGDSFNNVYETSSSGGVSIRVSDTEDLSQALQFEYSLDTADGLVFYDLTTSDGDPFASEGTELVPSDGSYTALHCPGADTSCEGLANTQESCSESASLTLSLCTS